VRLKGWPMDSRKDSRMVRDLEIDSLIDLVIGKETKKD
jgi:hypothetical protein